jgi:hypothetical protein
MAVIRDRFPPTAAPIAIDAERVPRDRRSGQVRHDERDMPGAGDDGMGAVGVALSSATGVSMDVGSQPEAGA